MLYGMRPLVQNIPEVKDKNAKKVECPICGRKCWERPELEAEAKKQVPEGQEINYVCTECALRNNGNNFLVEDLHLTLAKAIELLSQKETVTDVFLQVGAGKAITSVVETTNVKAVIQIEHKIISPIMSKKEVDKLIKENKNKEVKIEGKATDNVVEFPKKK